MEELDLVGVADLVAGPDRVDRRLAIALRRHVGAALQQQSIERVDVVLDLERLGIVRRGEAHLRDHEREHLARHDPVGRRLLEVLDRLVGRNVRDGSG